MRIETTHCVDGFDPNRARIADYDTARAWALFAALGRDISAQDICLARDSSGRWAAISLVDGGLCAVEVES